MLSIHSHMWSSSGRTHHGGEHDDATGPGEGEDDVVTHIASKSLRLDSGSRVPVLGSSAANSCANAVVS